MARITWNPKGSVKSKNPSPIAWSCLVFMREDGTFETDFKGETGFQMMKAIMDALSMDDVDATDLIREADHAGNEDGGMALDGHVQFDISRAAGVGTCGVQPRLESN